MFTKKKTAPRSGEQYKVGPPFSNTHIIRSIILKSNNKVIIPIVTARVDRGFDKINDLWIGYKRNYFTLVASFQFKNQDESLFLKERFKIVDGDSTINITYFTMRLVSLCCEDDLESPLVQHTAKRDRGPQYPPPELPVITSELPGHEIIKSVANIRNDKKIALFNQMFKGEISNYGKLSKDSILRSYPNNQITKVCKYERVQFASSLDCKKTVTTSKHFRLRVELMGVTETGEKLLVAYSHTPSLIIRGRSPSNYKGLKQNVQLPNSKVNSETPAKEAKCNLKIPIKPRSDKEVAPVKKAKESSSTFTRTDSTLIVETSSNLKVVFGLNVLNEKNTKFIQEYKVVKPLYSNIRGGKNIENKYFAKMKNFNVVAKSCEISKQENLSISKDNDTQPIKGLPSRGSLDSINEYFKSNEKAEPVLEKTAVLDFPVYANFNLPTNYKLNELEKHGIVVEKRKLRTGLHSYRPTLIPKFFSSPIKPVSKIDLRLASSPVSASTKSLNLSKTMSSDICVNPKMLSRSYTY
ncbi:hypothetical protein DFJ63DRAFT_315945 [Scheffersomyces coipomensis]|uniref:uncharacterized protein n=1 Tax=Scheffersomyces coipomensis TaxID=1788519 RepID=UPI00315D50ED